MTQKEAYSFCYSHQKHEDDYEINIRVSNYSPQNGYLLVVCNDIYHYMDRDAYQRLKDALETVKDDFNVVIKEYLDV